MSLTRYSLRHKLDTKELSEAIERWLGLWDQVQTNDATRVKLHVITSHPAPVELLATAVPTDARGFSPLSSSRNLTAGEALDLLGSVDCPRDWTIDLNLSALVDRTKIAGVLALLRQMRPDPLRRSALLLNVENIRWPHTPATSTGGFSLDDAKHFGRKIRFNIQAYVDLDGPTKPEIARILAMIGEATSLDFSTAKRVHVTSAQSPVLDQLAEVDLLFDHCIESVSRELLASGFDWSTLTGVFPDGAGVDRRFAAMASGKSSEFRWDAIVSQFVKAEYTAFKKVPGVVDDALTFLSPISERWSLALVFDKHPGIRIGRVFKLRCGIVAQSDRTTVFTRTAPVLRCSGYSYSQLSDFCPEFSFNTIEELDQILASLRGFLGGFLNRLRKHLHEIFLPGLIALERVLPVHGALSCDDALAVARQHLSESRMQVDKLWCVALTGIVSPLNYRQDARAQCPADGRLTKHHAWQFTFASAQTGMIVTVPWAGTVRRTTIPPKAWSSWSDHNPPISSASSFNSPAIFAKTWRIKDHLARRYPTMAPLIGMPRLSGSSWLVSIEFSGPLPESGWVRTETKIDAGSAEPVSITFDERLPGRPEGRVEFVERGPFPIG